MQLRVNEIAVDNLTAKVIKLEQADRRQNIISGILEILHRANIRLKVEKITHSFNQVMKIQ